MSEFWQGVLWGGGGVIVIEFAIVMFAILTNDYSK